ncbi:MAG: hypothetical protein ABJD07_10475 [Gemmatimonadaceae bacterium]
MRKLLYAVTGLGLLVVAASCKDPLNVHNSNNPDVTQVLGRPSDIETVIGNAYVNVHQNTLHGGDNIVVQLTVMALESYSGLANFGMGPRVALPRNPISNQRGNAVLAGNYRDWSGLSRAARAAANALAAAKRPGIDLNLLGAGRSGRARSFGFFALGVALGDLALVYDSATVISPYDTLSSGINKSWVAPLALHDSVMRTALRMLAAAIAISTADAAGFPLPATWINGNALTQPNFVRVIRSYKARFRANVARTPAEGAAVDWASVIADAQNGVTADLNLSLSPSAGWDDGVIANFYQFDTWHSLPCLMWCMAADSAAYSTWLAQPFNSRTPFLIITPDLRFPQGATRAAQNTYSNCGASTCSPPDKGNYIRNRTPGLDRPVDAWAASNYDHYRFQALANASPARTGNWPTITLAEMNMLIAEGKLRTATLDIAGATALIDVSRTRNNLPALSGVVTSLTQIVPGGTACVPKVPAPPTYDKAKCGTLFEAMKWEKRMETAYTGYGQWYFDGRRWGDLAEGTALEFPVPYQEMDARTRPFYDLGGVGRPDGAAKGTYGF